MVAEDEVRLGLLTPGVLHSKHSVWKHLVAIVADLSAL